MRKIGSVLAMLVVTASLLAGPSALANDADVIREGNCSGAADWKLKLSPENGRIEVEFEVDQNINGRDWRVKLFRNGNQFFTGIRTTQAPSGSFEVRRVTNNGPGTDNFVATARALDGGQTCRGTASF